jgi:hypothetical protein
MTSTQIAAGLGAGTERAGQCSLAAPVAIDTTAADILSATAGVITADDAAADKIVFWDDSADKLTYLTVGSNLTITNTTIAATGGGGGGTEPSNPFLLMGA